MNQYEFKKITDNAQTLFDPMSEVINYLMYELKNTKEDLADKCETIVQLKNKIEYYEEIAVTHQKKKRT